MENIPEEFMNLLPRMAKDDEDEKLKPLYYLWVYDPQTDRVTVEHDEGKHAADHALHSELASHVPHPDRVHGYAYPIKGGYRITDWEHRAVKDPHIKETVRRELMGLKPKAIMHGSFTQTRALKAKINDNS